MKRFGGIRMPQSAAAAENYEHMLMCLICRSLFDDHEHQPKFLPCHHTFCKECLREYVRQMGDDIECPSCRKVATIPAAGVAALQTNFYAKYIQTLVYGSGAGGVDGDAGSCEQHPNRKLKYHCEDCEINICDLCLEQSDSCSKHNRLPLPAVAEHCRQSLDSAFTGASTQISRKRTELEGRLKALASEKDCALLKIESAFESYVHTLGRRATLLKNKVIDIYNENAAALESGLEEIDTALTCVVSLREYYEAAIARGDFASASHGRGSMEIDEVARNINDRIKPPEVHLVFDNEHGIDKFRACTKDLGRVICNRPAAHRVEEDTADGRAPLLSVNSDCNLRSPESIAEELLSQGAVGGCSERMACGDAPDAAYGSELADFVENANELKDTFKLPSDAEGKIMAGVIHVESGDPGWLAGFTEKKPSEKKSANESLKLQSMSMSAEDFAKMFIPSANKCSNAGSVSLDNNRFKPSSCSPKHGLADGNASSIKNNNYCSPRQWAEGSSNAVHDNSATNSHVSFSDKCVQREASSFDPLDDEAPAVARMTRSEIWSFGRSGCTAGDDDDHSNVIAELSGEQTSL